MIKTVLKQMKEREINEARKKEEPVKNAWKMPKLEDHNYGICFDQGVYRIGNREVAFSLEGDITLKATDEENMTTYNYSKGLWWLLTAPSSSGIIPEYVSKTDKMQYADIMEKTKCWYKSNGVMKGSKSRKYTQVIKEIKKLIGYGPSPRSFEKKTVRFDSTHLATPKTEFVIGYRDLLERLLVIKGLEKAGHNNLRLEKLALQGVLQKEFKKFLNQNKVSLDCLIMLTYVISKFSNVQQTGGGVFQTIKEFLDPQYRKDLEDLKNGIQLSTGEWTTKNGKIVNKDYYDAFIGQTGGGVLGDIVNKAIDNLPMEVHVPGYNFLGPGTHLDTKLPLNTQPVNKLDGLARTHDIIYNKTTDTEERDKADKALARGAWEFVKSSDSNIEEKITGWLTTTAMNAKSFFH